MAVTQGGGGGSQRRVVQIPSSGRLSPEQLIAAAYAAGWRGRGLVEIVAISLAESGGNPQALNPSGEHSVGLTQINMNAHGTRFGSEAQLRDPVHNFWAARQLSSNGKNLSPWSVHRTSPSPYAGKSDQYLRTVDEAAQRVFNSGPFIVESGPGGRDGGTSRVHPSQEFTPQQQAAPPPRPDRTQEIEARNAEAQAQHQQRILQFMDLALRSRDSRRPVRPVRPAFQARQSDFDPAPFQQRVRELQGSLDLTPQVQRRTPGGRVPGGSGSEFRERMLEGFRRKLDNPQDHIRAL